MSRKQRRNGQYNEKPTVQTPVLTAQEGDVATPATNGANFFRHWWKWVGAVAFATVLFFGYQVAKAEEAVPTPQPPSEVVVETMEPEETAEAEPVVEEEPSKLGNALRYLFKGDAAAIVSEAEADYQRRLDELNAKQAQLDELELIIRNEEELLAKARAEVDVGIANLDSRVKALTKCVAKAMDEEVPSEP